MLLSLLVIETSRKIIHNLLTRMQSTAKRGVIAITGANRGLGYALAERLLAAGSPYSTILLCSRDLDKGKSAAAQLAAKYQQSTTKLEVLALDTSQDASREQFCSDVKKKFGTISSIVNNAGVMIKDPSLSVLQKTEQTAATNLFGIMNINDRLLDGDLLDNEGVILNISSKLANSAFIRDQTIKDMASRLKTEEDLHQLYNYFLKQVREDPTKKMFSPIFPFAEYGFLKLLLNKYTGLLSRDPRTTWKSVDVFSVCPGWCKTDMGGQMATQTPEQGTDVSYYLLTSDKSKLAEFNGKMVYKLGSAIEI